MAQTVVNNSTTNTTINYAVPEPDPPSTTKMTYVTASDVSSFPLRYVSGSIGQVKTLKVFPSDAAAGEAATLTTLHYGDATNPTKPTYQIEAASTVEESDLPS